MTVDRWGKPVPHATLRRRRIRLTVGLVVLITAALGTLVGTTGPYFSANSGSTVPAGLFVSSQSPGDVLSLGQRLGVTPTVMTVYADGSCYCTYADPPSTSMTLMLGVGALTPSEATSIGQSLVQAGQSNAIIRVMWEQNQDVNGWFQDWNQLSFTAAQYISTFQSIVTTMRAVPGQAFKFMWNPNGGTGNEASGRSWNDTWPGQAYVNYVGVDQYDYSGYAANIQAVIAFAQSQGLPAAIPEWGLDGSDDPSYINGVASLVNDPANKIALEAYFSYDGGSGGIDSDITQFPASEAAFTVDFSGSPTSLPTTTPTTSPPVTTTSAPPTTTTSAPPSSSAPHVMVVMMENEGSSQIIGDPSVPFINGLASTYGSATQSYAATHPSLPNYLDIVSGSTQGVTQDQPPSSGSFPGVTTLADQLAGAGYSATAFAENLPSDPSNDSGLYAVRHFPWVYFPGTKINIEDSSSMTSNLNGANAPDFVWYTPNITDDGHTGVPVDTPAQELADSDAFLSSFIPSVQSTAWYKTGGQIVIEWDEALDSDTSGLNGGAGGHVATVVVSAGLKANPQQDSTPVDTVGVLRSIEDTYGLSYLGGSKADGNIDSLLNPVATTPPPPTTTTTSPPRPPVTTTTTTTAPRPPVTTTTTAPPRPPVTTTTTAPPKPPATTTTTSPPKPPTTTAPPPAPTTTTTSPSPPPPPTATPVTTSTSIAVVPEIGLSVQRLTASVSPAPGGGTVQFTVDGWVVGDAVPLSSDGTAVIALYMTNGSHAIDATYSGDSDSTSSSAATVVGVGQALTTLTVSNPAQIGSAQLYHLSANLSSAGTPVVGAPIWFSAEGSALCVATTDATGQAACSIDEGTTDVFSLATQGVSAAFGGDATHLPVTSHSPNSDSSGTVDSANERSSSTGPLKSRADGGAAGNSVVSPPLSPVSVAATDTPATLDAADATVPGSGPGAPGLFLLIGLLGIVLVGVATFGRRRLVRARHDDRAGPTPL